MFLRFSELRERREGGFTLIELLVVILIIAILAAIAIPVFLNQRKKGWISQVESALKNAATAQESYLTGSDADRYAETGEEGDLETDEGLKMAADVTLVIQVPAAGDNSGTRYCMEATHAKLTDAADVWSYDSDVGKPEKAACA